MNKEKSSQLTRLIFFVGWLLSPFTFWNDCLINIPLAYLIANIILKITGVEFVWTVIALYWFTNFLGMGLMYLSGKRLFADAKSAKRELITLFATMAAYSIILIILDYFHILRPFIK